MLNSGHLDRLLLKAHSWHGKYSVSGKKPTCFTVEKVQSVNCSRKAYTCYG